MQAFVGLKTVLGLKSRDPRTLQCALVEGTRARLGANTKQKRWPTRSAFASMCFRASVGSRRTNGRHGLRNFVMVNAGPPGDTAKHRVINLLRCIRIRSFSKYRAGLLVVRTLTDKQLEHQSRCDPPSLQSPWQGSIDPSRSNIARMSPNFALTFPFGKRI